MANKKITELTATTTLADTDVVPVVTDPAGSPATKKITLANLKAAVLAAPSITGGATIAGGATVSSGNLAVSAGTITASGNITTSGGAFTGSGSGLTSIPAAQLTGTLPAISGVNLTNLNGSNITSGTVSASRLPGAYSTIGITTSLDFSSGAKLNVVGSGLSLGNLPLIAFASSSTDYVTTGSNTATAMTSAPIAGSTWYWIRASIPGTTNAFIPMLVN